MSVSVSHQLMQLLRVWVWNFKHIIANVLMVTIVAILLLLMEDNIDKLCNSISAIVYLNIQNTNDVYDCIMAKCELFKLLFKKYAKCHVMMNSARLITEDEIISLQNNINEFMMYLRCNWPGVNKS